MIAADTILNALSAHIAVLDREGKIVATNRAWDRFANDNDGPSNTRQAYLGVNYIELCESAAAAGDAMAAEAAQGLRVCIERKRSIFELEYPCHSPTRQRWFLMRVTPLDDESGSVVVAHEDITARKQAELRSQRDREQQRVLRELLEIGVLDGSLADKLQACLDKLLSVSWLRLQVKGGVYLKQGEMLQLVASRDMEEEKLAGCLAVPIGRCLCGRVALGDLPAYFACVDERHDIRYEGMPQHGHYILPLISGEIVLGVLVLWLDPGHGYDADEEEFLRAAAGVLAVIVDHHHSRQENERLLLQMQQAGKMEALGRLAGGVAHDFNNLLASILGYASLARERYAGIADSKLDDYLEAIQVAGRRGQELAAQMLLFGRPDKDVQENVDVARVMQECMRILRPVMPATLRLELDVAAGLPPISSHAGRLSQVLMNLCINARDAQGGQGRIDLRARTIEAGGQICSACHARLASGPWIELSVADQGPGIPQTVREHLFEPFVTTKSAGEGGGMGLALVNRLVHLDGGHVVIETGPEHGTIFRLLYPIEQAAEQREQLGTGDQAGHRERLGRRILLVDDEALIVRFLNEYLTLRGYVCTPCASAQEALARFTAQPQAYDLLLTDYTMPEMTGDVLALKLKEMRPDLRVVITSGYADLIDEARPQSGLRRVHLQTLRAGTTHRPSR